MNNQTIPHFFNLCPKEVIVNIIYPSTINKIGGYLDTRIIPTSVRYIIPIDKEINNKRNKINISQGGDIIRRLRKNNLEENG